MVGRRSILLALVALLAVAAAALAAHPKDGGLYIGSAATGTGCRPASACNAVFRVSGDGKTMRLTGTTPFVVGCPGGGGEFLISTKKSQQARGASPPPVVKIHANGTFYGARTVHHGTTKTSYHFTGRFTGSGKTLVLELVTGRCSTGKIKLTLRAR